MPDLLKGIDQTIRRCASSERGVATAKVPAPCVDLFDLAAEHMSQLMIGEIEMKAKFFVVLAGLAAAITFVTMSITASSAERKAEASESPVFGVQLPDGYRDWQVVSVAHEAGNNNDIRAILGNDVAMRAFRNGIRPFPDGTIVARLAYRYEASDQNNAIFGQVQSFVAGAPTNVQISVKDSKRYANSGGWGYGQFESGKANQSTELMNTCFACHKQLPKERDLMFTNYAP